MRDRRAGKPKSQTRPWYSLIQNITRFMLEKQLSQVRALRDWDELDLLSGPVFSDNK